MKQETAKQLLKQPLTTNQQKEIKKQWNEMFPIEHFLNVVSVRDMLMDIAYND